MSDHPYGGSNTHAFFEQLRAASVPLPDGVEVNDNTLLLSQIRKRAMRPRMWPVVYQMWAIITRWRQEQPSTAGVHKRSGEAVTHEVLTRAQGRGKFGYCLSLGATMVETMLAACRDLRADEQWAAQMSGLDREIQELMWDITMIYAQSSGQSEQVRIAKQHRAAGRTVNQILGQDYSLENMLVDEVDTAFRTAGGLVFVGLSSTMRMTADTAVSVLQGSSPVIVDWANQSVAAFEGLRAAQEFSTARTRASYGPKGLANASCYQIVRSDTLPPYYAFTDKFIGQHTDPLCAQVRELCPYRISCGGVKSDGRGVSPVADSVTWMAEIVRASAEHYESLVDDC